MNRFRKIQTTVQHLAFITITWLTQEQFTVRSSKQVTQLAS